MGSRGDDRVMSRAHCKPARSGGAGGQATKPFSAEQVRFFETEVQPILKARCLKCHGGGPKVKANFRVDSREALLRGGTWVLQSRSKRRRKAGCCRRSATKSWKCRPTASCPRQRSRS